MIEGEFKIVGHSGDFTFTEIELYVFREVSLDETEFGAILLGRRPADLVNIV